jgi:hypothetical protein
MDRGMGVPVRIGTAANQHNLISPMISSIQEYTIEQGIEDLELSFLARQAAQCLHLNRNRLVRLGLPRLRVGPDDALVEQRV